MAGQEAFIQLEIANVHGEFPSEEQEGAASHLKAGSIDACRAWCEVKILGGRGFMDDGASTIKALAFCSPLEVRASWAVAAAACTAPVRSWARLGRP